VPVLFIYGPADPINLRSIFPQKLRQDLPKIKLSVLSEITGHYPQYEDYFTVFQLILKFIKI
jgi:pimeloyl-ACP methyl ester carboxylesterase